MIKVWPVAVSGIDWQTFIRESANATGHSPAKGLDNCKIKFSAHAKQIISLMEFVNCETTPSTILSQSDRVLGHLFFSFIILAPVSDLLDFISQSKLEILISPTKKKNYRLGYVSGTLAEWKQSLEQQSEIASICLDFFNNIGLKQVFTDNRRYLK